jgi:hypothetical protein
MRDTLRRAQRGAHEIARRVGEKHERQQFVIGMVERSDDHNVMGCHLRLDAHIRLAIGEVVVPYRASLHVHRVRQSDGEPRGAGKR